MKAQTVLQQLVTAGCLQRFIAIHAALTCSQSVSSVSIDHLHHTLRGLAIVSCSFLASLLVHFQKDAGREVSEFEGVDTFDPDLY